MSPPNPTRAAVSLALSASFGAATCALRRGETTFGPIPAVSGQRDLAAAIEQLFREADLRPRDLSAILLDLGPGSYTGLRVAVTYASFCRAYLGTEVRTVTSLELMAVAAWRAGVIDAQLPVRPVIDARRNRFHHALIGLQPPGEPRATLLEQPRATSLDELTAVTRSGEQILAAAELRPYLAGEIAASSAEPVRHDATLLFDPLLAPRPACADLEPLYLMGSYAERPEG